MTEVTFTVEDLPPGINRLLRMNRFDRRKAAHAWGWQMRIAVTLTDISQLKKWSGEKLSVSMHVVNGKLFDEDNLNSLAKIPLDSMRALGWLENDSPEFVQFQKPTQEIGKKAIRFTIRPAHEK
jgi:hypothetical protein